MAPVGASPSRAAHRGQARSRPGMAGGRLQGRPGDERGDDRPGWLLPQQGAELHIAGLGDPGQHGPGQPVLILRIRSVDHRGTPSHRPSAALVWSADGRGTPARSASVQATLITRCTPRALICPRSMARSSGASAPGTGA